MPQAMFLYSTAEMWKSHQVSLSQFTKLNHKVHAHVKKPHASLLGVSIKSNSAQVMEVVGVGGHLHTLLRRNRTGRELQWINAPPITSHSYIKNPLHCFFRSFWAYSCLNMLL